MKSNFTYCILFFLLPSFLHSQNLEKIGSHDFLTINGGLNFNTVNYQAFNMESRRDPFTWFASGNLNINFLDVSIPLTYSYSNLGGKFTQPFNQFSIHPTYKWIKSHIGYSTMNFSSYTLAGHLFIGAGIELNPGKWNFQLMRGRLNKAIEYDIYENNINAICYKRIGTAIRAGYNWGKHELSMIALSANDDENSLKYIPLNTIVKPKENFVLSGIGKTTIFKNIQLNAEYAISILTNNTNSVVEYETSTKFLYHLIHQNSTTSVYQAYKSSLQYKLPKSSIGINYEHIDPGYLTLGGYYFNNDIENYTLSYSGNFLKGKLNFSTNTGYQFNNLDNTKAATTKRLVGNTTINCSLIKNITFTLSYSNFSNFTRKRMAIDPNFIPTGDTLNFYNQSQAASFATTILFGNKKIKHNLTTIFNYTKTMNLSGNFTNGGIYGIGAPIGKSYDVINGNQTYGIQFIPQKLNIATGINTNYSILETGNVFFIGPMLMITKNISKSFSINAGSIYNRQYVNQDLSNNIFNHKLSISYKPNWIKKEFGKFTLSCNTNFLQKLPYKNSTEKNSELTIYTNINYAF